MVSRTQKAIKNILVLIFFQILGILINFFARYFFLKYLGEIYLGLNGVLTNIMGMLSFAELGIGSAIAYSLYKPIAEDDTEKIKSIMAFFKKVYIIIGIIVFAIGMCLLPLMKLLVGEDYSNINNLYLIFILFTFNNAITYFYSYKRTLLCADQNKYIDATNRYVFYIILNIVQIIILHFTKNFILFLVCQTISNILENISITIIVNKKYPFIKTKTTPIDAETKKGIFKNTTALIYHKLGGILVTGIDSILITIFVGLTIAGRYSNYTLITAGVVAIISQFFTALTASVGNLGAIEDGKRRYEIFKKINFASGIINTFTTISILILANNFISVWLGDYLLNNIDLILICLIFFLQNFRRPVLMFKDALGIYRQDRFKPIFEVIVNLLVSILFGLWLGLTGVLLGTIFTYILVSIWVEVKVLFKYGLKTNVKGYILDSIKFLAVFMIALVATILATYFIPGNNIVSLIIKLFICLVVPNAIYLLAYIKSDELKYFISLLKRIFKRIFRRNKATQEVIESKKPIISIKNDIKITRVNNNFHVKNKEVETEN